MTYDPEAAERLAQTLIRFDAEFQHDGRPIIARICAEAAALIRAQAAERKVLIHNIRRINDEYKLLRNAALREAAAAMLPMLRGMISRGEASRTILALIDTPAPPAEPAGEATKAMVDAAFKALPADADGTIATGEMYRVIEAALAAAPAPIITRDEMVAQVQSGEGFATAGAEARWIADMEAGVYDEDMPAPQPDADEREALVAAIREGCKGHGWLPEELPRAIADALLADGWTRKREEG